MAGQSNIAGFYRHASGGASILLPSKLSVASSFPELYAKSKTDSIIILITSGVRLREAAELNLRQIPNSIPGSTDVNIIRNAPVSIPYPGHEVIIEVRVTGNPVPRYRLDRVLYLDASSDVIVDIRVSGDGLFCDAESRWQTVLDSFSWDAANGIALKFDGDEVVHRAQYKKKRRRVTPAPRLPAPLRYLQPVIDMLLSLPPEDVNEDFDTSEMERLLIKRVQGLSLANATKRLQADVNNLNKWIESDLDKRAPAAFAVAWMRSFDFANEEKQTDEAITKGNKRT